MPPIDGTTISGVLSGVNTRQNLLNGASDASQESVWPDAGVGIRDRAHHSGVNTRDPTINFPRRRPDAGLLSWYTEQFAIKFGFSAGVAMRDLGNRFCRTPFLASIREVVRVSFARSPSWRPFRRRYTGSCYQGGQTPDRTNQRGQTHSRSPLRRRYTRCC